MTATSPRFSSAPHAATEAGEPLTSSPMTRSLADSSPSATRTTLTLAPLAVNPSTSPAPDVAGPHSVGGYAVSKPNRAVRENPCVTPGNVVGRKVDKALTMIPTCGCHLHVQRERLLGAVNGIRLTRPGLAGFQRG